MTKPEATIGTRVRAVRGFYGVPVGTEGVVDEHYLGGVMVAWDPKYDGVPTFRSGIVRDGFGDDELDLLEVI